MTFDLGLDLTLFVALAAFIAWRRIRSGLWVWQDAPAPEPTHYRLVHAVSFHSEAELDEHFASLDMSRQMFHLMPCDCDV